MADVHRLPRPTEMAHRLLKERMAPGSTAVDATVGNGHDTVFLADCVGPEGQVIGMDLQESAIAKAAERTSGRSNIHLHHTSHENIDGVVNELVSAITFNLGYLPGGEKSLITKKETTLVALEKSLKLLQPGGLITIVAYIGHEGGTEEGDAVASWASSLDQEAYSVIRYEFQNQRNSPPFLIAVERRHPSR